MHVSVKLVKLFVLRVMKEADAHVFGISCNVNHLPPERANHTSAKEKDITVGETHIYIYIYIYEQ